jgi:hypothetical protein
VFSQLRCITTAHSAIFVFTCSKLALNVFNSKELHMQLTQGLIQLFEPLISQKSLHLLQAALSLPSL